MIEKELWVKVEGFNDYEVSSYGRVFSKKRNIILKQYEDKGGYMYIYLYKDKKIFFFLVHRLVGINFLERNNLPEINHKDFNKKNNNVNNLEWCTSKYNNHYSNLGERARVRMSIYNHFTGKKHTNEAKNKMSIAKLGKPSKRRIKVIINGVEYESKTMAMKSLKIGYRKLDELIKLEE